MAPRFFMNKKIISIFFSLLPFSLTLFLCACSHSYGMRSLPEVKRLSLENNFTLSRYETEYAPLLVATNHRSNDQVHVYIEGDGIAWLTENEPSLDPTPLVPTAFNLALLDRSGATCIYLGRPGQYFEGKNLSVWDWTDRRFSPQTIRLYQNYFDRIRRHYPDAKITLLGYSGGATIALLIAAHRNDIEGVITFAGLLDTEEWVAQKGFSPLISSLNPADFSKHLSSIRQHHFIGKDDSVITRPVVRSYLKNFPKSAPITVQYLENISHWSGWEDMWKERNLRNTRPPET